MVTLEAQVEDYGFEAGRSPIGMSLRYLLEVGVRERRDATADGTPLTRCYDAGGPAFGEGYSNAPGRGR